MSQTSPSTSAGAPSPLSEADERSLDFYFSQKPPFDAETLLRIKQEFRRRREVWAKDAAEGKTTRSKKVGKAQVTTSVDVDLFAAEDVPSGTR
jgi:hypothetical protein